MTQEETEHKTKRKSNNPNGRPVELKGGKYIKVYVDEPTIQKLKQIHKNQSKAVRMAVSQYIIS